MLGIYRRWILNGQGKKYWYWYAAHYVKDHQVRWCYIGKNRRRAMEPLTDEALVPGRTGTRRPRDPALNHELPGRILL